jgi:hypothetical protein
MENRKSRKRLAKESLETLSSSTSSNSSKIGNDTYDIVFNININKIHAST